MAAVRGALDRSRVATFQFPPLPRALDSCSLPRSPQLARALDGCRSCTPFSDLTHTELQSPHAGSSIPGVLGPPSAHDYHCSSDTRRVSRSIQTPLRSSATWFDTSFHVASVSSGQLVFYQKTAHFFDPFHGAFSARINVPPEMVATRGRDHGRFEDCGLAMRSDIGSELAKPRIQVLNRTACTS